MDNGNALVVLLARPRHYGPLSRAILNAISVVLIVSMAGAALQVEAQASGEYSVKAAFIYNFAKYVEWPQIAGPGAPLIVGVVGQDPFGGAFDQMVEGKIANGRQLVVKRLKWGDDLKQCQILFISASEERRLSQILNSLNGASVLTVGDTEQFGKAGGIIRFVLEDNRVRFEINRGAAERARLKLSSRLLALARQ
ncbi:MAG TPA: YfiR family protein [Blastocatellia bacterium]|nr:YfiR family protein [Blastocatellia bacterium]